MNYRVVTDNGFLGPALTLLLQKNKSNCAAAYFTSLEFNAQGFIETPGVVFFGYDVSLDKYTQWIEKLSCLNAYVPRRLYIIDDLSSIFCAQIFSIPDISFVYRDDLLDALDDISEILINSSIYLSISIKKSIENSSGTTLSTLSKKEKLIAKLIVLGKDNWQVSEILDISIETIKNHRKNIKRKLNIDGGKNSLINCLFSNVPWLFLTD
ncbi:MAG: hypothetical protein BGO21_07235 [Dyadobacter sp. 50-39]|uniref:helix-turn-helix domain-containing protein n=1 Tax=Dyadobacter sp. 50-39 TaxID=1895756 RepID=UPI0009611A4B|nr:helix-turn-helix transcriptional regulator [Dyadobacter sp. 50-39]OJV17166.1 MAG: hypothetical protein BGO21_07235 [Dyadobacter sp. 50-39]